MNFLLYPPTNQCSVILYIFKEWSHLVLWLLANERTFVTKNGAQKICLIHYLHYHSHTQFIQTFEKFYSSIWEPYFQGSTPNLKKSTHIIANQHTVFIVILNNPRRENMDQNSLCSALWPMDKYHPKLPKVKIQNVHPCFVNDEFPNQSILTP